MTQRTGLRTQDQPLRPLIQLRQQLPELRLQHTLTLHQAVLHHNQDQMIR